MIVAEAAPTRGAWRLDGQTGWRTGTRRRVTVGASSGIRLTADPDGPLSVASRDGTLGGLRLPPGMAFDARMTLHLLGDGGGVLVFDPGVREFRTLLAVAAGEPEEPCHEGAQEPGDPRELRAPTDLAIVGDTLYVADPGRRSGEGRLLAFDLRTLVLVKLWGPAAWEPRALATAGDRIWILDTLHRRLLQQRSGETALTRLAEVPADGWDLAGIAVDEAGRAHVLERRAIAGRREARLLVFGADGRPEPAPEDPGDLRDRFEPPAVVLDDHERFCLSAELMAACGRRLPGTPPRLDAPLAVCAAGGGVVFGRHGTRLAVEPASRAGPPLYAKTGTWVSRPLDSGIARCQWHRLQVDVSQLPPGTILTVSTYADERTDPLGIGTVPEDLWVTRHQLIGREDGPDPSEGDLLVQSRAGRYLWVRLELRGDGYATPAVRSIHVRYPREAYVEFLPAVYSADDESRWFLERFLSVFQTELEGIEGRIRDVVELFDPQASPAGPALDWLAETLGLPIESRWAPEQRRPLVVAAREVAPRRGTLAGIRRYLRAYLESMTGLTLADGGWPQLVEGYRERVLSELVPGGLRLGHGAPLWSAARMGRLQLGVNAREGEVRLVSTGSPRLDPFDAYAHRFRVFVPGAWVRTAAEEGMVRRALDAEKPAHTAYDLCLVEPRFRVGVQSTVGLDTIVAAQPVARLACGYGTCGCGGDPEHDPAPSLAPRGRLGFDTVLACRPGAGPRLGPGLEVGLDVELT